MKNVEKKIATQETGWSKFVLLGKRSGDGDRVINKGRKQQEICIIIVHYQPTECD